MRGHICHNIKAINKLVKEVNLRLWHLMSNIYKLQNSIKTYELMQINEQWEYFSILIFKKIQYVHTLNKKYLRLWLAIGPWNSPWKTKWGHSKSNNRRNKCKFLVRVQWSSKLFTTIVIKQRGNPGLEYIIHNNNLCIYTWIFNN